MGRGARRRQLAGIVFVLVALGLVVLFAVGTHRWWYLAVAAFWLGQGYFWLRAARRYRSAARSAPARAAADPEQPRRSRDPSSVQVAAAYGRAFGYLADREARKEAAARHEAELEERAQRLRESDAALREELARVLAEQEAERARREAGSTPG